MSTCWFMPQSYSSGNLSVTYSLTALGIEGVKYETSSALEVTMLESNPGIARLYISSDASRPELGLSKEDVMIVGDSMQSDIAGAEKAGIKAVLIDRRGRREYENKILSLTELEAIL